MTKIATPPPAKMNLTLSEVVLATGGRVVSQHQRDYQGITTDTRALKNGDLFVALKGETYDAHEFLQKAADDGAFCLLVHRLPADENSRARLLKQLTVVEVEDTLKALQALGHFWRRKMPARILGVTGTNGKTTTKEFAAAMLGSKFEVQYSKGSFNNHWGVPISLLSIRPQHQVAVIEMGMNHPGELTTLCKIAEPDVVVVTMVGRGHLEGMGSIAGVARAKKEIYDHAPKGAVRIFNLENPHTEKMFSELAPKLSGEQIITFAGTSNPPSSRLEKLFETVDVRMEVTGVTLDSLKIRGVIRGVEGSAVVPVFGTQNVTNLMAASCLCLASAMSPEEIWRALPLCRTVWGRNQWVSIAGGARVLFDAYNANPESMHAAVENFRLIDAGATSGSAAKKFAVLGEMREMGAAAGEVHRELGEQVAHVGFSAVVFVGPSHADFATGLKAGGFQNKLIVSSTYENSLASELRPMLDHNDLVLMKGSRGMELERVLKDLHPLDFTAKT